MTAINDQNAAEVIAQHMLVDGFKDITLDLERSKGCYIHDSRKGRKILDFFNFFATAPLGYNHPRMLEEDFLKRLTIAAVNKPSCSDFYTIEMAEFVDTFARIAKPDAMKYMFFVDGGALGVENAFKAAVDWKIRKNIDKGVQGKGLEEIVEIERKGARGQKRMKGTKFMHFEQSFHGRTGYTMSLTHTADPRKYMFWPKFDWPRILNPKCRFPLEGRNLKNVESKERRAVEQMEKACSRYKDDIAAVIIEPVQGEGGDNHFRPEFFREIRRIATENDMMFIVDEIQSGMGLTGKWWAVEHYGVEPDMICFGKKIQTAGFMVNGRIDEVKDHCCKLSARLNSTFGGNLVDFIRATRYLEVIKEEELVRNAEVQGKFLIEGLWDLAKKRRGKIKNVRGKGLMVAFETPSTEYRDELRKKAYSNDMLILASGVDSIRFRPPLNVGEEEIKKAFEILDKCIGSMS